MKDKLLIAQRNETTENKIYDYLSRSTRDPKNKKVLKDTSNEELGHYNIFKKYTGKDIKPNKLKILKFILLAKLFGLTFAVKLMENGEKGAQKNYEKILKISEARRIINEENGHEKRLIGMINEERMNYVSSIVLGLNDALVELTSSLAGLTLAIQNSILIGITGFIIGFAASLSMAASGYLQAKEERGVKNPKKALMYTGAAYILTVLALITPYFIFNNIFVCLTIMLGIAIIIILAFTYYTSVARDENFRKKSSGMIFISMGIAGLTFFIGFIVRVLFNIQI